MLKRIAYLTYCRGVFLASWLPGGCRQEPGKVESDTPAVGDTGQAALDRRFRELNEQLMRDSMNPALRYERAQLLKIRGNVTGAYQELERVVELDSTRPEYYLALADVAFRALQVPRSVEAFERCLQLDPKNSEAHLRLAELYFYLKAYPKSIESANNALRLNERLPRAYSIKGFVYKESGDTGRAVSSFQTVLELDPENYDAQRELGRIFAAKKDPLALQYYNNAMRIRPGSGEILYNRGLYYQETGQLDQAEADYRTLLAQDPKDPDAHHNLGYIALRYRENYKQAISHFDDAIRMNPEYAEAYYHRGLAEERLGDKSSALRDYKLALNIYPSFELAKAGMKRVGK